MTGTQESLIGGDEASPRHWGVKLTSCDSLEVPFTVSGAPALRLMPSIGASGLREVGDDCQGYEHQGRETSDPESGRMSDTEHHQTEEPSHVERAS